MCSMKYPDWEDFMANSFAGRRKFPLIADELPTFLGVPHVTSKDELKGQDVVIIGAPYVATATDKYAGVDKWEWISGPKRVRQQSVRYGSGYIQDFDIDVFEHLNVVDYGDADIPEEVNVSQTPENILKAQAAVEEKVGDVLEAGGIPIVIGQNSPLGSFAIAKSISEHTAGQVGCVSLDTHWDAGTIDRMTNDPRIAGSGSWKHKMYEFLREHAPEHPCRDRGAGHAGEEGHRAPLPQGWRAVHLLMGSAEPGHRGRYQRA